MLHAHHAQPPDGDDYTYEIHGEVPGASALGLRDAADALRVENEDLRDRLLRARVTCAQLTAIVNRLSAILNEGA